MLPKMNLTEEQKEKLRKIFEPLYKRKLSDDELWKIHKNLMAFGQWVLKIENRVKNKAQEGTKKEVNEYAT